MPMSTPRPGRGRFVAVDPELPDVQREEGQHEREPHEHHEDGDAHHELGCAARAPAAGEGVTRRSRTWPMTRSPRTSSAARVSPADPRRRAQRSAPPSRRTARGGPRSTTTSRQHTPRRPARAQGLAGRLLGRDGERDGAGRGRLPPSGRREASASPMSLATSRSPQRSSARATRSVSIRSIPTPDDHPRDLRSPHGLSPSRAIECARSPRARS